MHFFIFNELEDFLMAALLRSGKITKQGKELLPILDIPYRELP